MYQGTQNKDADYEIKIKEYIKKIVKKEFELVFINDSRGGTGVHCLVS